jgi:phosphopantetheinyl transferase
MPVSKIYSFNNARVLVWEVTETIDELKQQLTTINQSEWDKLVSDKRKREYLGVRIALKELIGEELVVSYTVEGKPYLANSRFEISISHSGKWIAVMVHSNQLVGVDIEVPTAKIQKVYTRFLSEKEQFDLSGGSNVNQLQLAWSAKEALFKIIGKEAVDFAKQLRIYLFEPMETGEMTAVHIPTNTLYKLNYIQHPEYTLVYCLA